MLLPRLFKTTKTGATQVCDIFVNGKDIIVSYGQAGGKMQSQTTTCKAKNVGKSNETSPEQQASLEAQAKWEKKCKAGYSMYNSGVINVRLPQKVKSYKDNIKNVKLPAYSTFKLNGVNATYWLTDDVLSLTSRGGNQYPPIPHLEEAVRQYMADVGTDCLNGELYIHGEFLQDITSAVKKPKELSKRLQFYVFELPHVEGTYEDKISLMTSSRALPVCKPVKVDSHKAIKDHYDIAMASGYEGTVIYNADATYKFNERSSDVFKYKEAIEAEFKVFAFNLDKHGHAVYTCSCNNGSFKVKRKGTNEERLKDAKTAASNIDKWLTVEYEMLSKDGVPLKPVGLAFRDCDTQGRPLI